MIPDRVMARESDLFVIVRGPSATTTYLYVLFSTVCMDVSVSKGGVPIVPVPVVLLCSTADTDRSDMTGGTASVPQAVNKKIIAHNHVILTN